MTTHLEPRQCRKCGEWKPFDDFKSSGRKDANGVIYRLHVCKPCAAAARRREYRQDPVKRAKQIISAMNAHPRCNGKRVEMQPAIDLLLGATECHYCGLPNTRGVLFSLDHKVPIARGGAHSLENLVPACEHCNLAKNDTPAEEYVAWLQGVAQRMFPRWTYRAVLAQQPLETTR